MDPTITFIVIGIIVVVFECCISYKIPEPQSFMILVN